MSKLTFDQAKIDNAVELALLDTVLFLERRILEITPRDPARPPKNPNAPVTGDLKRSIGHEQKTKYEFGIGTKQGEAEYGKHLEFGTPNMEPRSFLRKGMIDNKDEALKHFARIFKLALK